MFLHLEEFESVEEECGWKVIKDGDWVCDGKWEFLNMVVQNEETGKYYSYDLTRSGSYYSDYYYQHTEDGGVELTEVVPKEVTVVQTQWVAV